jgi:hypothetical protein
MLCSHAQAAINAGLLLTQYETLVRDNNTDRLASQENHLRRCFSSGNDF